ncbi:Stp1/IreP family PP2C-type Ser/Thr phosphatase [bacterium]|nr:Stp1/IreP family PP2C-type Ser/Thr phosphatase [bacterium]
MTHRIKLAACGISDCGKRRPHNEDSILVAEDLCLFLVADGMGGHAAGEVASRTAVQSVRDFISQATIDRDFTWPFGMNEQYSPNENILLTGFLIANRRVCRMAEENTQYSGMGTTLAAIYAPNSHVHIAHVGDSRVYRLRSGELGALTVDHSWVNEQLQRNIITEDEARTHRWRNIITRALGNRADLEVDLKTVDALPGDVFLICSDGLTGMVEDEKIQKILLDKDDDLQACCQKLVDASNQAGGIDNISVVLVKVLDDENA